MSHDPSETPGELPGGEFLVSPAMRRKLQQCYEHGTSLMSDDAYDYDYAHTMFVECVVQDPGNLVYVEAFLDNLQRKYQNNKRGARMLSFGGKTAFKKALARQDWKEVLRSGPALLKTNPWDVQVLRGLAQACEAYHFNEAELRYLKNALDANPKDADVNRHCALSLARMGQFDQAIACWHRVEEAKRHDAEAPKMISALTIEKARARAGYGSDDIISSRATPAGSAAAGTTAARRAAATAAAASTAPATSPVATTAGPTDAKAQAPAPATERATAGEPPAIGPDEPRPKRREIELTRRQKLERAIVDFPEGVDNYLQLAQLHLDEQRPAEAERVLAKAVAVSGGDIAIRERLEDATAERIRQQLAVAEQRAEAKQTEEAYKLVEEIRHNLARYEMELLQARAERYPQDPELKFQLGRRLKRLGNYQEAAAQLQHAQESPQLKASARLEMGECLQHLKQYPKALLAYERAIDAAQAAGQTDVLKLALYRAGVLATALRQLESAQRHLEALERLDAQFKDLADRLDKLRQIRHKG